MKVFAWSDNSIEEEIKVAIQSPSVDPYVQAHDQPTALSGCITREAAVTVLSVCSPSIPNEFVA